MPLSIPLPASAKIIINGAVIENSGSANITLTVHNKANILRDKDVLTKEEANSPAKEIYHSVQNAYLFEPNRDEWLNICKILMDQFLRNQPESAPILAHVVELIDEDKLYNALRACRRLIAFEAGEPVQSLPAPTSSAPRPESPERQGEMTRMKEKIADLEKRITALDQSS